MGLYDNYRLSNSQQVKQYQGSVVPELVNVSQEMQKRYDTAQNNNDYTGQFLDSIDTPFAQDRPELERMKGKFRDSLTKLSARPDLENAVRETTMLARQLPQEYAPFAASAKALQERKDELDKATQKKPEDAGYLTPEDAKKQLAEDVYNYKGLQRNGADNQLKGIFSGGQYTRSLNFNKEIDAYLEHAKPVVNGVKYERVNGEWINSSTRKATTLAPETIQNIIAEGMKNNPEVGAYLEQQKRWATYNLDYSRLNPDAVIDTKAVPNGKKIDHVPVTLKDAVQQRVANGEDFNTVMKDIIGNKVVNDIVKNAHAYGINKYAQHDTETESSIRENSNYWRDIESKAGQSQRFLIPGNDTVLEEKDKDLDALNGTIGNLQSKVTQMTNDMKIADPAGRARIQSELDATKDALSAKQELLDNTKNAIAQRLSGGQYKTAAEYYDKTFKGTILKSLPATVIGKTLDNSKTVDIDNKSIYNAIKDGRIKRNENYVSSGNPYGAGGGSEPEYVVTLENGRQVKLDNKHFDTIANAMQTASRATSGFETAVKEELKNNASNYAVKPLSLNLSKNELEGLGKQIDATPNAFAWTKPGSLTRIADKDLPAKMDVGTIQVMSKNGSYYLNSRGLDKDGKPTGDTYTGRITPGSDVGKRIASNLIAEAKGIKNMDAEQLLTAKVLSGDFKYTGSISSLQNYEPLTIKDKSGNTFLKVQRVKGTTDSDVTPIYALTDDKGNVMKDSNGAFYQTPDPTVVDFWIQHALQNDK